MRLTQHTDYSLRVLLYLGTASNRGDELTTIKAISEAYGISRNHLMKVVQDLVSKGYVESVRGVGGGIRLGLAPKQINIGSLIRDMEPDFGLVECFRPGNECVVTQACTIPRVLNRAMRAFMTELDSVTLANLLPKASKEKFSKILSIS